MNKNTLANNSSSKAVWAFLLSLVVGQAFGAATPLSDEPIASSSAITAKPNIMFVLDDSGSMRQDYLPDWAGPYQQMVGGVLTTITPAHRFFNRAYNGVAYNPGTYYQPPVMYTALGTLDTTTYPSMNGQSTATGGDASANAGAPNWRAVKVDGYGIQSTATANLEGQAYSYTTIAGEYCDSKQLRTCVAASAPDTTYTQPAYLRWCTTSMASVDTTTNAGTLCQAGNIDDNAANIAAGVTPYTFPRMARPRTANITVNVVGDVTSISVDGQVILKATASGGTTTDVATAIAAQINACTYVSGGACTTIGFSAVSLNNVVTITAPTATTSSPVVSGGNTTPSPFTSGNVPGVTLFTVISPSVASYPFPGSAVKSPNRIDCAGTTCTYTEEMTNYANWYTYYRTRMQMMKTAASIAFSNVDDNFRVGYFSINNGSGSDFINLSAFNGTQKNLWYSKFFNATPFGQTPLRTGLANAGKIYAGKITSLNGVAVSDPMQYSCQQNYTILSTDGYWNETALPTQLDGSTPVGEQDGNDPRPFYDGATQTRTVSQTTKSEEQLGINTLLVESRTQQQQTSISRLTQSVTTTTTYPYQQDKTRLRTRTIPVDQTEYRLEKRTYPLKADIRDLEERTFYIQQTVRPLERYTYNLDETSYPLQSVVTNITKTVSPLQQRVDLVQQDVFKLQQGELFIRSRTTPLQMKEEFIQITTAPLQQTTYNITRSVFALQTNTYNLTKTERQLQKRMETSSDGGDTWQDTGWVDASSCTVAATGPGYTRNTQCRYNTGVDTGGQSTCTVIAPSTGPNYTVPLSRTCLYETTPVVVAASPCTASSPSGSSPYSQYVTCSYAATSVDTPNQTACTAYSQSTASRTGDQVVCTYQSGTTANASNCTATTSNTGALPKITCGYGANGTPVTGQTSCTAKDQSGNAAGVPWSGDKTVCAYQSASWAWASTCTARNPGTTYSNTRISCQYGTTLGGTGSGTWSAYNQSSCAPNSNTSVGAKVDCQYQTTPSSWTNVASCPYRNPTDYSQTQIVCQYAGSSSATTNPATCSPFSQPTNAPMTGDQVACSYATGSWSNVASCTSRDPGTAYNNSKVDCQYGTAGTPTTGNTSCTAVNQSTNGLGVLWSGDKTVCDWDTSATTSNTASCTWNDPGAPTATMTKCQYGAGTVTNANITVCTPVAPSTGTANGTTWNVATAKTCAYRAAVVATGLTNCSPSGTNNGTNAYTTCGYGTGVVTNNLSSCVVDPPESGPNYTGGSTTACVYQTTYTGATTSPCNPVAAPGDFSTPYKTCVYKPATTSTGLGSCTDKAMDTGAPYTGPATTCYYDTTASAVDTNASTCGANRQTSSPYTGPAVDCAYSTTPIITPNVGSCATQAQSAGPSFVGPERSCNYGTPSAWSPVLSGSCTAAQSTVSPFTTATECAYNGLTTTTYVGTCTPDQSAGPVYTVLQKTVCTPGSFPVVSGPVVTTVDSCSTDPTSSGSPVVVSTVTTCGYQTPEVFNTTTCTPRAPDAASPYQTAIDCPVSDTGYVAVAPSCTPTVPPATFNAAGTIVECRTTDTTPYTTGYPSGPVAVASCTPGTDPATQVQTTCTTLLSTGPTPVDASTCVTRNPPVGPDFVRTTCDTTTTTSTAMGCTEQTPTAPLWQTATCVYNGDGTSNTLADVAAYYYKTDLRTMALGNCTGAIVPPATTGNVLCSATDAMNNVRGSPTDPATWQHMTTFTLGLGASGYMRYSDTYLTDTAGDFATVKGVSPYAPSNGITANPASGVCSWQTGGLCNWPFPVSDEQTGIDDLWHAAVNGHAAYYSAGDPASLSAGISSAMNAVAAAQGSAAAPSLSSPNLSTSDNYIFNTSYVSLDWTGDLVRYRVDPFSGIAAAQSDWSARDKLDAKAVSTRNIYVFDATVATTKLKPFTSANFTSNAAFNTPNISSGVSGLSQFTCTTPVVCLSAANQTQAAGANLVNYLRGDRTHEGAETDNTAFYRQRLHILGDMVNSQAVYVNQPTRDFGDPGYADFKTAPSTTMRQAVVYVGANDGMLHAFAAKGNAATEALVDAYAAAFAAAAANPTATNVAAANAASAAASAALASDPTIGQELWAYIPSIILPNLYKLADKEYRNKHRYFIDATPVVADVCTSNCADAATATWKTILVGGLGHGGRGYFALDITNPSAPKALWEFTDANLGYSYGNPQIAKLANGRWVVLFASGYNNIPAEGGGDGVGRLYVVDAGTGAQVAGLSPLSTGSGDASNPSGLAQISAMVTDPQADATISAVYGGDLNGNLWRFYVDNVNHSIGTQLLAALKDGAGNAQPITTKPVVTLVKNQPVVYVGTGRFLDQVDIGDTSQQSLYAIKDPGTAGATPTTPIFDNPGGNRAADTTTGINANNFVVQVQSLVTCPDATITGLCDAGQQVITSTRHPVDFLQNNGWVTDLINPSERANTNPALALGLLAITTNAPSLAACDVGGKSYLYFLDYVTGGPIVSAENPGGILGYLFADAFASAPVIASRRTAGGDVGRPVVIVGTDPSAYRGPGQCSGPNCTEESPLPASATPARRSGWRELILGQ
jgi:Tfp pilus tip-associated adhesin PilY1